jgi:hypothetical protein
MYSDNGHKPINDTPDLNLDFLSESSVTDTEDTHKPGNKKLKNIGICLGLIVIGAIAFKGTNIFQAQVLPDKANKENIEQQVIAPEIPTQIPSNSVVLYQQTQQRVQQALDTSNTQYNRMIYAMMSNLISDAKKSKGMSPEEYLLRRGSEIAFRYQSRLIKRDYDFESATGMEEVALLIPRLQAWYLAYQVIQGTSDIADKFGKKEKVPPALAEMIADLNVVTTEGITLFQAYPEAQLRMDVTDEKMRKQEQQLEELKRQVEELTEPESDGVNAP